MVQRPQGRAGRAGCERMKWATVVASQQQGRGLWRQGGGCRQEQEPVGAGRRGRWGLVGGQRPAAVAGPGLIENMLNKCYMILFISFSYDLLEAI